MSQIQLGNQLMELAQQHKLDTTGLLTLEVIESLPEGRQVKVMDRIFTKLVEMGAIKLTPPANRDDDEEDDWL